MSVVKLMLSPGSNPVVANRISSGRCPPPGKHESTSGVETVSVPPAGDRRS
ncbi:hypothetical protein [Rhodovulum sp. 12E13]|uniref:hypothetical protein n=1 Tax=Rhodovulum sp. 12E13 TaxID=2203891 RepID=UPI0013140C3D|nr:hypothetical protein [Rhodovulum sp. 12E13]